MIYYIIHLILCSSSPRVFETQVSIACLSIIGPSYSCCEVNFYHLRENKLVLKCFKFHGLGRSTELESQNSNLRARSGLTPWVDHNFISSHIQDLQCFDSLIRAHKQSNGMGGPSYLFRYVAYGLSRYSVEFDINAIGGCRHSGLGVPLGGPPWLSGSPQSLSFGSQVRGGLDPKTNFVIFESYDLLLHANGGRPWDSRNDQLQISTLRHGGGRWTESPENFDKI
ncbi:UNKNOWN [Stylonychia lemnae]|uniref:Uncharacterized protein n=1 Tax=Stylonychia lemnae TaxID=5949 RepID=A0A078B612_STYLE|nr:UNKNOWN [Stylonychia lemnae]|eukprot:CDW89950.1 UNKNOWN [Stylonychia lemnae]